MTTSIKLLLLQELHSRRLRNPAYSLRALSRDLKISLTALSSVMNGSRDFSPKNKAQLIASLQLSPLQAQNLNLDKAPAIKPKARTEDYFMIAEDEFRLISDWYSIAILNLAKLKSNQASPHWIAKRLGISQEEAKEAQSRLRRLGLIKVIDGKMRRTAKPLKTSTDVPSSALRKHQQQNLLLAEKALHQIPVHLREFSSVVMTANREKLPKVKEILLKTRKKIADLLEDDTADEVYTLAFQLFPLTQLPNEKDKK